MIICAGAIPGAGPHFWLTFFERSEVGVGDSTLTGRVGAADAIDALVVNGVSHRFGEKQVLDNVHCRSRAGHSPFCWAQRRRKSTLFALITRLYDNVSGEIRILGHDVRRKPTAALQRLGVVFQSRTLDSDLTLEQNLFYHAALHGIGKAEAKEARGGSADHGRPSGPAHEKIRNLSGGQARRVEIARSLLHRPGLLLLDEATVGLDIGSRESVLSIVRGLVDREGLGVLWATHLIDEIAPTDRVVVLHKGAFCIPDRCPACSMQRVNPIFVRPSAA